MSRFGISMSTSCRKVSLFSAISTFQRRGSFPYGVLRRRTRNGSNRKRGQDVISPSRMKQTPPESVRRAKDLCMATCEVCENEYDKAFEVVVGGQDHADVRVLRAGDARVQVHAHGDCSSA